MSISRQNLSVIIVSFKSEYVIHQCINSIDEQIEIIVVENSNNEKLKFDLEKKYKNVRCILSSTNIGMGAGNNLGIKEVNKDYAFILNPDVILEKGALEEIIKISTNIESFGIIAPISSKNDYPNYKFDNKNEFNPINPFQVKSVDGYAMLLNLKRLKEIKDFEFFDENFFLYLENDDICKRIKMNNENIYVVPQSKITHLGGKAVDPKYEYEIELLRNWHWMWSKFYFNKKHFGILFAFFKVFGSFVSAIFKIFFYSLTFNKYKKKIYQMRLSGLFNSILGRSSFYRPNLDD